MSTVEHFHQLANPGFIFSPKEYLPSKVANMWYQFSVFIPRFLAQLALASDSKNVFSRLISISNEEMGDGRVHNIHSEDFREACNSREIDIDQVYSVESLGILSNINFNNLSDSYILGIHLGLEIVANENIQNLIDTLDESQEISKTKFFKIHLINEDEHIRKCVDNFKMCKTSEEQDQFLAGFNLAIKFWTVFWKEAANE